MTASKVSTDDEQLQPLTVKGLIEELSKFSPDIPVVVDGYEGGFDSLDVDSPRMVSIRHTPGHEEWEGEYEDAEWNPSEDDLSAVHLPRKSF